MIYDIIVVFVLLLAEYHRWSTEYIVVFTNKRICDSDSDDSLRVVGTAYGMIITH